MRERLRSSLTPVEALRTLRSDRHPFCLHGVWFGGGAVLGSEPTHTLVGPAGSDPFDVLDAAGAHAPPSPVGVHGGWVGYLGYRAGRLVERLPPGPDRPRPLPDWWLAHHDHVLRYDPPTGWWFEALWTDERAAELDRRHDLLAARLAGPPPPALPYSCGEFRATPDGDGHRAAVRRTIEHIEAGDIYQANVCLRFDAELSGEALDLFARGAQALEPPYGAFLDMGDGAAVASLSPEQFLRRVADHVTTRPIKGTRRRSDDAAEDDAARRDLEASGKDRAENVMIVDLMRNDLGRVSEPGSITVPHLVSTEPHPGVWHLVSEVTGQLSPWCGDGTLLRATFPPGSVTGAPKVRAMEVIAEVETSGREVYTGSIGMVSPTAGAEWSVAIRTFEVHGSTVWLGAGGGIVAESDPDAELDECRTKARPLVESIGARLGDGRVSPSRRRP